MILFGAILLRFSIRLAFCVVSPLGDISARLTIFGTLTKLFGAQYLSYSLISLCGRKNRASQAKIWMRTLLLPEDNRQC